MITANLSDKASTAFDRRSNEILMSHQTTIWKQTDRLFVGLLVFQFLAGIAAALWISPRAWEGLSNNPHPHVWAAIILGGLIVSLPLYMAYKHPARELTRHTIAAGQMLFSALIIHLLGGRIETHFHIFGSLAFLAIYRDWRVLVTATTIASVDHLIRGCLFPQSVFGVATVDLWRAIEHTGWVLFEDLFLIWSCLLSTREMRNIAIQQAKLESTNELIESQVKERTADLAASQLELIRRQVEIRAIVDAVADGIVTVNERGTIESANQAAQKLFGYSEKEIAGRDINTIILHADLNHEAFIPNANGPIEKANNASGERELFVRKRDGTTFAIEMAMSEVQTEGHRKWTGIIRDVTVRKEAEARLAEQARLAEFSAEIGRVLVSAGGLQMTLQRCVNAIIAHFDMAFTRIWTLDEVQRVLEPTASAGLFTQIDGPNGWNAKEGFEIGLIAEDRTPYRSNDVANDHRIGNKTWIEREGIVAFAGCPLIVEDRVIGVVTMFARHLISDSSFKELVSAANSIAVAIERAHTEVRLKAAMVAAKHASMAKSQFLANMSHELRTPMNAIIGYSELLVEEMEEVGEQQYQVDLKKILASGTHLLHLINDILDLSKIEAGKMNVYADDFEVELFVKDVAVTVQSLVKKNGNTFVLECEPDLRKAYSDETKIRQILLNLLGNAAKFTQQGQVKLKVSRTNRDEREYLEFQITDSGIGMTPEQLTKICEPFIQAELSTTLHYGGTGLGLTITNHFCQMLGGSLQIESESGVGSRFTARIPVEYSEPDADSALNDVEDWKSWANEIAAGIHKNDAKRSNDNPNEFPFHEFESVSKHCSVERVAVEI